MEGKGRRRNEIKSVLSNLMMARNLLKNSCGEEMLEFWELTENGGSEWKVEPVPGDCGHAFCNEAVSTCFATSFELCLKRQVVNLVEEGFSTHDLDSQPAVTVEDWYSSRTDCGCVYQLSVSLLDENHEVLQEFNPEEVTLDPGCSWKQVSHSFTDYGPGLRFISFEHGGQDTRFWDGWFGVRVTGSVIRVEI
ncbi:F-box only protein 2 isoform X3 [Brienomyrus brachyistius]|nr:F-box only protein 2 isoform X3 [Brienomyrus brachyistius]